MSVSRLIISTRHVFTGKQKQERIHCGSELSQLFLRLFLIAKKMQLPGETYDVVVQGTTYVDSNRGQSCLKI